MTCMNKCELYVKFCEISTNEFSILFWRICSCYQISPVTLSDKYILSYSRSSAVCQVLPHCAEEVLLDRQCTRLTLPRLQVQPVRWCWTASCAAGANRPDPSARQANCSAAASVITPILSSSVNCKRYRDIQSKAI